MKPMTIAIIGIAIMLLFTLIIYLNLETVLAFQKGNEYLLIGVVAVIGFIGLYLTRRKKR